MYNYEDSDRIVCPQPVICPSCDGSGEIHSHNPKCWDCNGTGIVSSEKAVEIKETDARIRKNFSPINWDYEDMFKFG